MGQRLSSSNRRIISENSRRVRKQKIKILIAAEGKNKTEKLYFSNFDDGRKGYSISFAKGNDTDPVKLVKRLIEEIDRIGMDLEDGDIAYCIFDTDTNPRKNTEIKEAMELAKENGIQVITSTPSIELWFLLHFEYTTASMTNKEVISRLKKYYPKYEKNINIYPDVIDKQHNAMLHAKRLEKYQLANKKAIGTVEANPNTEIYKVVESLLKS